MSTEAINNSVDDGSGLASEMVVIGSMALVSGATGMAGFLHAGLSSEMAAAVSVATLSVFMMSHVARARSTRTTERAPPRTVSRTRSAAGVDRHTRVTLSAREPAAETAAPARAASRLSIAPAEDVVASAGEDQSADRISEALARALAQQVKAGESEPDVVERHAPEIKAPEWTYRPAPEAAAPVAPVSRVAPAAPEIPRAAPPTGTRAAPVAFELPELSPTIDDVPPPPPPAPVARAPQAAPTAAKTQAGPPPIPVMKPGETEMISGLLKRLAAQIETGQRPQPAPQATDPSPALAWAREKFESGNRNLETIDDAVDALQSAVGSMRASLQPAPAAQPETPVRDAARERLEAIADAIATERMDVMLEPILGLKQHRAQHFSVSVRLHTLTGETLDPDRVIEAAAGTGLLSMFDALRVKRASGVAVRLDANGRPGAVFSDVSGEGVTGEALLRNVEQGRASGEILPERLVLTFTQEDLRVFTPGQWRSLANLRDLGFRFAVEQVTHLGMDFESLAGLGFAFVKLDASVFLQGLPQGSGMLPASDVCRHFASVGMAVVVTGIEDETVHARVMGFGALLGQGSLFGAPRPVRSGSTPGQAQAYA